MTAPEPSIRDVTEGDLSEALALNNGAVPNMNELDLHAMRHFAESAPWFRVATREGAIAGFIIALRPDSVYDSPNFRWFQEHYDDFVYVDRIVVAAGARRGGVGRALYADLDGWARKVGAPRLCAEVNLHPPNPTSIEFHRSNGWKEVGQLEHPEQGKRVVLLVRGVG